MAFYVTCKDKVTLKDIEDMEANIFTPSFKKLKFVNVNKEFYKKLMYIAFKKAKARCDKRKENNTLIKRRANYNS